jgi:hypothetical protein
MIKQRVPVLMIQFTAFGTTKCSKASELIKHKRQNRYHRQQLGSTQRDIDSGGLPGMQQCTVCQFVEERRYRG